MKLNFPKIIHEIDLGEYDEAMKGQKVSVWVNPTGGHLVKMGELNKTLNEEAGNEDAKAEYLAMFSELLSQGEDKETHVSAEELQDIIDGTKDTDPRFWMWFQVRIVDEINSHRLGLKKG